MVIRRAVFFAAIVAAICLLGQRAKADLITNGNFETGTLAGWTVFTTPNGTNGGAGLPDVVSFNTTGSGASDAAQFNVGQIIHDSTEQGGGLSQVITAPGSGTYTLTEDFASQDDANGLVNEDAGTFSIIIDGTPVAKDSLGAFSTPNQILRGTFDETVSLTGGSHTIEVEIARAFISGGAATPEEYVDNISLVPTPEPSSLLLLGTGILGVAGMARRKAASLR